MKFFSFLVIPGHNVVHSWSIPGPFLVHSWSQCGSFLVHSWFIPGSFLVYSWYIPGIFLVHSWFIPGRFLVESWSFLVHSLADNCHNHLHTVVPFGLLHIQALYKYTCYNTGDSIKTNYKYMANSSTSSPLKSTYPSMQHYPFNCSQACSPM